MSISLTSSLCVSSCWAPIRNCHIRRVGNLLNRSSEPEFFITKFVAVLIIVTFGALSSLPPAPLPLNSAPNSQRYNRLFLSDLLHFLYLTSKCPSGTWSLWSFLSFLHLRIVCWKIGGRKLYHLRVFNCIGTRHLCLLSTLIMYLPSYHQLKMLSMWTALFYCSGLKRKGSVKEEPSMGYIFLGRRIRSHASVHYNKHFSCSYWYWILNKVLQGGCI